MKHLGDITGINGAAIEPVDCITFGSPCQDLSVAGHRAGLAGERSGLFMEAVRVIKEMRCATNGLYPTFAVWENVPGAFSSNGGEDFRTVLEELARIKQPDATIPRPDKGKWLRSGLIDGCGFSIAWRLLDAQYWGVPQRRKRIALVVDFGGQRAGEILFERESLRGDSAQSCPPWKGIARNPTPCAGTDNSNGRGQAYTLKIRSGFEGGGEGGNQKPCVIYAIGSYDSNAWKSGNPHSGVYEADVSRTLDALNCGNPTCNQGGMAICEKFYAVDCRNGNISPTTNGTLQAKSNGGQSLNCNGVVMCRATAQANAETLTETAPCLNCDHEQPIIFDARGNGDGKTAPTMTGGHNGNIEGYTAITAAPPRWIVRRLTPLECERLQGYPDGWTDIGEWTDSKGKKHKPADTPRYKALGNSIALPQWWWLTCKMAEYLPGGATLGSLFDGIGGFPLVWEMRHGKGTARWASEIEEFCKAVTKRRFGGNTK